jgi:Uma2 family endonuclease
MRDPAQPSDRGPDAGPDRDDVAPRRRALRPPRRRVTLDEYLAFERRHPARHEFVDGYVYAMTGAKLAHNRIVGNVHGHLWTASRRGPCRTYVEAAKLRAGHDVFYPDVMVVCDPAGEDEDMALAPCLIVEVLSPATAQYDRSLKRMKYQALPSLLAYLVVSQRERHVVRHWRDATDSPWQQAEYAEAGDVPVPCPAPGVLTLDQLYEGVAFGPRIRRVRERRVARPRGAAAAPAD